MSAKKVTYTDSHGFTNEISALIFRVANAAMMQFEGQTVDADEFGAAIEAEYKVQSGKKMTFQSYMKARDYIDSVMGWHYAAESVTVPSIMDSLTTA